MWNLLSFLIFETLFSIVAALPASPINRPQSDDDAFAFLREQFLREENLSIKDLNTFTPGLWLGHGIDMTAAWPLDIESVGTAKPESCSLISRLNL